MTAIPVSSGWAFPSPDEAAYPRWSRHGGVKLAACLIQTGELWWKRLVTSR